MLRVSPRYLLALLLFVVCMIIGHVTAFDRNIAGEEGVVLDCIRFEYWRLLLPEDDLVHGCTVDHMPLYHLIAKLIFSFFGHELYPLRLFSIIVSSLTSAVLFIWISEKGDKLMIALSLLAVYSYISSDFVLKHFAFIRMYSLYALLSLCVFIQFERFVEKRDNKNFHALWCLNLIAFANYALHGLLIIIQLPFMHKLKKPGEQDRGYRTFIFLFGIYSFVKLYFLVKWRIIKRSKDDSAILSYEALTHDFLFAWLGEQDQNYAFYLFGAFTLTVIIMLIVRSAERKNITDRFMLSTFLITIVAFCLLRYGLDLREVSFRYFLFLSFVPFFALKKIAQTRNVKIIFIVLLAGVALTRGFEPKLIHWQRSQFVLGEVLKFTKTNLSKLNADPIFTDSLSYYGFYVKSIHDFQFKRPIQSAIIHKDVRSHDSMSGWHFLFLAESLDQIMRKGQYRIVNKVEFTTPFDEGHKLLVIRLVRIKD